MTTCNLQSYEGCTKSIQPFWISREPFTLPWCNLAACQRRPYCASVNSHSPVGLLSRQWDSDDWACVLCDRRIYNDRASWSVSSRQSACSFYISHAGFFRKASHHPGVSAPLKPDLAPCDFWLFPKLNCRWKRGDLWKRPSHSTQSLSTASHCRLTSPTGEWLCHVRTVTSPLTGCQVTSRPSDRFSRYSKWLDTFRTALVCYQACCIWKHLGVWKHYWR